eukprot:530030-Pelagomonas_calceolata.AAC.1
MCLEPGMGIRNVPGGRDGHPESAWRQGWAFGVCLKAGMGTQNVPEGREGPGPACHRLDAGSNAWWSAWSNAWLSACLSPPKDVWRGLPGTGFVEGQKHG